MKKYNIIFMAIALSMAFSCSKSEVVPAPQPKQDFVILGASAADVTPIKTTLSGLKVKWTESDVIVVNGKTSTAINVLSEGASAQFTLPMVTAPYFAISPASVYVAESFGSAATYGSLILPAEQTYCAGGFDAAAAVLLGHQTTEGANIIFEHAMAYIKFTVNGDTEKDNIKSITVKSRGTEAMSGQFNVNSDGTSMTAALGASTSVKLITDAAGVAQGTSMMIAIPAQTYASGIDIVIEDINAQVCSLSSTASFNAAAGNLFTTTVNFTPKAADISSISTVEDWAAFAQTVTDGNDYTGKTVTIENDIVIDTLFAYADNTFNGTLEGGSHVMTANSNRRPLFAEIGVNGKVQNLTVAGTFTSIQDRGTSGNAIIAKRNHGTIENVTNKAVTNLEITSPGLAFGGIVCQNGGTMKDCVNEGNMTLTVTTSNSAALYGGGIAAAGHILLEGKSGGGPVDVDETCTAGTFIGCVNKGDIFVIDKSGALPIKAAFGGIVGVTFKDGVTFTNCRNEGMVARYDNGVNASNTASCLGGIVGRAAATHTISSLAVDASGANNGYKTTFSGCINSGILKHSSRCNNANLVATSSESGARKVYTGGIVGLVVGKSASEKAIITGCVSKGNILTGWNGVSSHIPGGIAGSATNTTISDCNVAISIESNTETANIGSISKRFVSNVGAVSGLSFGGLTVSGGKYWIDANFERGNTYWYGLLVGLNYVTGTSLSSLSVGGSIIHNETNMNITSADYMNYLWSDSSVVSPVADNITWLSEKPSL